MKANKIYFINLIIFLTGLILLINPPTFAFDKFRHDLTMLGMTGPILSPSGDAIAFSFIWKAKDKVGSDIGILSLKSDEIQIITKSNTDGSLINEFPTWLKDSKHILFRRFKKDGYGLFSINLKTLKEKVLLFQYDKNNENKKHIETSYSSPIWFPLNDKIVFIKSILDRDTITSRLLGYIYDLKEKKEKEIAQGISNSVTFRHTWSISYDGNYVFYTKKNDKYNDIWLSDLRKNSNGKQQLTKGHDVIYLRASPVKNELLFVVEGKKKSSWALYKLNLKTRKEEKLLESNNYYNLGFPSWSQNGNLIVFVKDKNIINIMDVNKRKITAELKINVKPIAFPLLVQNRRIIFFQKYASIWSVDIEGKNLKRIFHGGRRGQKGN